MNFNEIFYQIYPLGMCGAPKENDGVQEHRILRVLDFMEHLRKLGVTAVYFGPVFESDRHGYDTRDYRQIDVRLGTNEDFKKVCDSLHEAGIKVILDGVFNHVGRGFFAFKDVQEKKWDSPYKDWFHINFDDINHEDGFWYEGWEGHQELVKLNLWNPEVRQYLFEAVDSWVNDYQIDGLRLDVAYMLNRDFLRELSDRCHGRYDNFLILGEMIGGDYNVLFDHGCDSVTNYECRKGIYSSFNSSNLFEVGYSLNRQFGADPWCLYTGKHLLSFMDNHDVDRIASTLEDKRDLSLAYDLLYAMPGMPCIYYGSEWGMEGKRTSWSDDDLRPAVEKPEWNDLTDHIADLSKVRLDHPVFTNGNYKQLYIQNKQLVFERNDGESSLIFALNIDENPHHCQFSAGEYRNLLTGETVDLSNGIEVDGKSSVFLYKGN